MTLSSGLPGFHRAVLPALLLILAAAGTTHAASDDITVTRFDDPVPAPQCTADDCTLRAAILEANTEPGRQTIHLAAGTFDLDLTWSIDGWYEDAGQTADMDINDDLTIIGAGMNDTVLTTTAPQAERAFDIHDANVTISGLTIRDLPYTGNPLDCGRAIRKSDRGSLALDHIALIHNTMRGSGGAICGGGTVTITDSLLEGNGARFSGSGGAIASGGSVKLTRVLLKDNRADLGDGGAIAGNLVAITDSAIIENATDSPFGTRRGGGITANSLTMTNVTVSGNNAGLPELGEAPTDSRGGGIFVWQYASLTNVTIANNQSGLQGGGIAAADGAQVTVANSIVSGNTGGDCLGAITSAGHNIAGDSTCGFSGDGDLNSTNPLLGPLLPVHDTYARPPLTGSPAIDSANTSLCPTDDQRGVARPQGSGCDRGAYEVIPTALGDVNCDGRANPTDAVAVLAAIADVRGADCLSAGDANGDHTIDARDALTILWRVS